MSEIPKVLKMKNGTPSAIEWLGRRYILDHQVSGHKKQQGKRRPK